MNEPVYARRASRCVVACLVAAACTLTPNRAHAYHTRDEAPIWFTGHVLPRNSVQLGLGSVAYGALDFLQVETAPIGFALPLFTGDFAPNINVRVGVRYFDPVFFSFGIGAVYVHLSDAHEEALGEELGGSLDTELWSMPMIGAVSYHPTDELLVSSDLSYFVTNNSARAATDTGSSTALLASSSLQGGLTAQYALGRVFAFTLKSRMVFWAPQIPIDVTGDVDGTTVTLAGNVEVATVEGAFQIIPGIAFSWSFFNLRLGAGYGNLFLPTLGLVSSYQGFTPDLELYFRF